MKSKEPYYTKETMVKDLLKLLSLENCSVLDAGSGLNKVWYNNLKCREKFECEIEDGCNFYKWDTKVDWIVGNPPFPEGWKFTEKVLDIAQKGIAFLGNINFFNQFTPRRLEIIKEQGFYLQRIRVVSDTRWFGRYYFLIFKKKINNFISWELKSY